MAVHFHKGKICFNGYLTEKDWTGIWLGSTFKHSSSCVTPCPAFLQKSCPASFFLLTHMILSPFDFDQFLLPVAGKKFSARAKSLRLPFLLSFFLSLKAGFSPMLLVPLFADFLIFPIELFLFSTAVKGLLYIWILYFSFGKRFHRNRHLFKHWTQHIFDCHVLLVAIALLWYHYKWLKYCFCLQFC